MAYKRHIDRRPIIPADAKKHNVTYHYCIVGCGYHAYTWTNKQGGTAAASNAFGGDLSQQQAGETDAWYAPSMYNIVKQDGQDLHIVIKPDHDCVVNSGLGSVRGARMGELRYSTARGSQQQRLTSPWSGGIPRCNPPRGTMPLDLVARVRAAPRHGQHDFQEPSTAFEGGKIVGTKRLYTDGKFGTKDGKDLHGSRLALPAGARRIRRRRSSSSTTAAPMVDGISGWLSPTHSAASDPVATAALSSIVWKTESSRMKYLFVGATMVLALLPPVAQAQDIEAGKTVFKKCAACHNADTDTNKVGPTLKGVVGRTAGTVPGYSYSKAMKDAGAAGLVWDEPNLTEYLANPKAKVPTNKMGFPGLKNPDDIKNVIVYLKSVSG